MTVLEVSEKNQITLELSSLEPYVEQEDEVFDLMIDALRTNEPFIFTKINHALWERLVFLDREGMDYLTNDPEEAVRIDHLKRNTPALVETGFLEELFELLSKIPVNKPNLLICAGLGSMPHSNQLLGIPREAPELCEAKIAQHMPKFNHGLTPDGLQFKRAAINGRLIEFIKLLRQRQFLLVANIDLASFPEFIDAKRASYIPIHGTRARFDREQILSSIIEELSTWKSRKTVVLQAGGALSCWLSLRLFQWDPKISIYDFGNALCICNPRALFSLQFGQFYRQQLLRTIDLIHPGWLSKSIDAQALFAYPGPYDHYVVRTGRSSSMISLASRCGVREPTDSPAPTYPVKRPIAFIENKRVDLARLENFIDCSAQDNHHANNGPIAQLLELALHETMMLKDDQRVILVSSCTTGLQIAASVASARLGRRLRWITAAFGFLSSSVGAFSDIRLVDCDKQGLLSLEAIQTIPLDEWDALLFTNTFALGTERWEQLRDYCEGNGKVLVVDNAVGLQDRPSSAPGNAEVEAVSLHHTKPWGYGEGGALVVPSTWESCARDLIQFGIKSESNLLHSATNAKVSDLSAGAILDRIETMPHWSQFYRTQAERVRVLVRRSDLPLREVGNVYRRKSLTGNLQFLAPRRIHSADLENPYLVFRKYYRPLRTTHPDGNAHAHNAHDLFQRIINVPCHPFVRLLSDDELITGLSLVIDGVATRK